MVINSWYGRLFSVCYVGAVGRLCLRIDVRFWLATPMADIGRMHGLLWQFMTKANGRVEKLKRKQTVVSACTSART